MTRMAESDFALARRLLDGEESAFAEFFAAYFPRLYRFARARLGGDEDAAEEIVQTTLIKAVDKLHTYRGEAALLTWLCTFCRREIAGWARRTGRRSEVSLADDRLDVSAMLDAITLLSRDDPETELHRREVSRLVQATLDRLPGPYGDALEWKYIEGLSVEEIGRRLGLGYKAAESLLTRAREAFRKGFTAMGALDRASLESGPTEVS